MRTIAKCEVRYNPMPYHDDRLDLVDLRAGDAVVDVSFERQDGRVGVKVHRKHGDVQVSVVL